MTSGLAGSNSAEVTPVSLEIERASVQVLPPSADLVEAALAAFGPERALGRDVDDVGVARVDEDPADVLGLGEAHVRPGLAAVEALVDAVAETDVAAADVLARAHPDGLGIRRVEGDAADRIGRLGVEDGRPGRAGVLGLPDAARADRDVPGVPLLGMNGDVADAAGHDGRADVAEGEAGEELGGEARRRRGLAGLWRPASRPFGRARARSGSVRRR